MQLKQLIAIAILISGLATHSVAQEAKSNHIHSRVMETVQELNKDTGQLRDVEKIQLSILSGNLAQARERINQLYQDSQLLNPWVTDLYTFQYSLYLEALVANQTNKSDFKNAYKQAFSAFLAGFDKQYVNYVPEYFAHNQDNLRKRIEDTLANGKLDSLWQKRSLVSTYFQLQMLQDTQEIAQTLLTDFERRHLTILPNQMIKLSHGQQLEATVYLPKESTNKKLPAILVYNLYAKGWNIDNKAIEAAMRGYAGVLVYPRGKGKSTGNIAPFETEAEDGYQIIDWISKQDWSNREVGMLGGSYLGFTQWAVTKKLHPALKTIVPSTAVVPGFNDNLTENGILKTDSLSWFHLVSNNQTMDFGTYYDGKWGQVYQDFYQQGRAFNNLSSMWSTPSATFEKWLANQGNDAYWKNFVPEDHDYQALDIPILATTGYFDHAQLGSWHYLQSHLDANKTARHFLLIGPYDHLGANGMPSNSVQGHLLDQSAHININGLIFDWFDHVFWQKPPPELIKDTVNFQVMGTNAWQHKSLKELSSIESQRFYLSHENKAPDNRVAILSNTAGEEALTQHIDLTDRSSINQPGLTPKSINELANNNNLVFLSEPLEQGLIIAGRLNGQLKLAISKQDADIEIVVFEVTPNNNFLKLTQYRTRLSYQGYSKDKRNITPHTPFIHHINNSHFISKKINKGSRLLVLAGGLKEPRSEVNYGTAANNHTIAMEKKATPLEIKWYGDSFISFGVLKKTQR